MSRTNDQSETAARKRDPLWLAVQADTLAHELRKVSKMVFLYPSTLETAGAVRAALEATAWELEDHAVVARLIAND